MELNKIYCGDCLDLMKQIPDESIDLVVTSPPYNNWRNKRTQKNRHEYWNRTNIIYDNCDDKMTDVQYEENQINVLNELYRIIKPHGTICYNHKDRIFNFEVKTPIEWILKSKLKYRQRITWDRCGMQAYNPIRFYRTEEDIYILGKDSKYKWNKECAKYMSIWKILPSKNIDEHPATFPEELVKRCVLSFTNVGDVVLDPYNGIGTTTKISKELGRKFIGFDISEKYCNIAQKKINDN